MTSTDEHHALALDLGSSSVRAVLGTYRQGTISTEEVFRLHHQVVDDHGTLTWDLERIMDGVRRSIAMATQRLGRVPDSIGIDTWGVDYGLLDAHGELLRAPRAYRDRRMARWAADLDRALPAETAWKETGILPQQINTVYQLYADLRQEPDLIGRVARFLPLPDLVAHLLGAPVQAGRAIASTSAPVSGSFQERWHSWSSQKPVRLRSSRIPPSVRTSLVSPARSAAPSRMGLGTAAPMRLQDPEEMNRRASSPARPSA